VRSYGDLLFLGASYQISLPLPQRKTVDNMGHVPEAKGFLKQTMNIIFSLGISSTW
jgi:hypothetical protein